MDTSSPRRSLRRLRWLLLYVAGSIVLLLPWWRNHAYLRSFFDYGVVMGGVGRIEAGQKPYTDFVTPLQTGWYIFNGVAEKIFGGTFQAMTCGAAVCAVLAFGVLAWLLARRWSPGVALLVAGCLVSATIIQHTLIWYNPLGVVLLAIVAWTGAMAPVWKREDWRLNVLQVVALFLGGINKINMQALAVAIAVGWMLQAGWTGRATWRRVRVSALAALVCGTALPWGAEMGWTGASPAVWWHNVVGVAAGGRAGMLQAAWTWRFYLHPVHDYYGDQVLQPLGLAGVLLTLGSVVAIWRHLGPAAGWLRRSLAVGGGVLAYVSALVLICTNIDIAYIAFAGWLALLIGLWLGHGLPARGVWFGVLVLVPALVVGAAAWESAWRGQRSQFGHEPAPRPAYQRAETASVEYAYLRGTYLPPPLVESLRAIVTWRRALAPEQQRAILHGPGMEWVGHIWPPAARPGVPLWINAETTLRPPESINLEMALRADNWCDVLVSLPQDYWTSRMSRLLDLHYRRAGLGPVMLVYSQRTLFARPGADSPKTIPYSPIDFALRFGGNVDVRQIESDGRIYDTKSGRAMIGYDGGTGELLLKMPTNRLDGEVVLLRLPASNNEPLVVNFSLELQPSPTQRVARWMTQVELPAGQDEIVVPYSIDSGHSPVVFTVTIPSHLTDKLMAGWHGPHTSHVGSDSGVTPAWISPAPPEGRQLTPEEINRLFPESWRPRDVLIRRGQVTDKGVVLEKTGEIWMRVHGFVQMLKGRATWAPGTAMFGAPSVRCFWYKDGRIELYNEHPLLNADQVVEFEGWCAEPGGWMVVTMDSAHDAAPVLVTFDHVKYLSQLP